MKTFLHICNTISPFHLVFGRLWYSYATVTPFPLICPVRTTQGDFHEKEQDIDPVTPTKPP